MSKNFIYEVEALKILETQKHDFDALIRKYKKQNKTLEELSNAAFVHGVVVVSCFGAIELIEEHHEKEVKFVIEAGLKRRDLPEAIAKAAFVRGVVKSLENQHLVIAPARDVG